MVLFVLVLIYLVVLSKGFLSTLESNSININVPTGLKSQFELGLPSRTWTDIKFCGRNTLYLAGPTGSNLIVHKYTITGEKLQFDFGISHTNGVEFQYNPSCEGYAVRHSDNTVIQYQNGNPATVTQNIGPCDSFIINTNSEIDCFTSATNDAIRFNSGAEKFRKSFGLSIREGNSINDEIKFKTGEIEKTPGEDFFLRTLEVGPEDELVFHWSADVHRTWPAENEEVSHSLKKDGVEIHRTEVTKSNKKWFDYSVGPNAAGTYEMRSKCENSDQKCNFDNDGINYGYTYKFRPNVDFGCNGRAAKLVGNSRVITCPGYDFGIGSEIRRDTNNFILFDSNITYLDHEHPGLNEGNGLSASDPLVGKKFIVSKGSKIYATQINSGNVQIKLYSLLSNDLRRGTGFVYDTGTTNINDIFLASDANDGTEIFYLIKKNGADSIIEVLQPLSNTQTQVIKILESNVIGQVTAFGADFNGGSFVAAVSGENITGFVSETTGNVEQIPFTKSGKISSKFPKNLIPDTFTDYINFPGIVGLRQSEMDGTVDDLIKKYIQSTSIKGYITQPKEINGVTEDRAISVLKARGADPKLLGPLTVTPGSDFYEVLPTLTHFFDYEDDPRTCIPNRKYCLFEAATEAQARDLCFEISRCEGYVGTCMIEARSYSSCTESTTQFYNKKKYRHRVFEFIDENPWPFIGAASGIAILHLGFVLRFHWYL